MNPFANFTCPSSYEKLQLFSLDSAQQNAPIPKRQPGEITDRTVLNVFGPVGQGGRYILDSLKVSSDYKIVH